MGKLLEKLAPYIKNGAVNICPNCNKATRVYTNPMYAHTCEYCGWKGDYRHLKIKTNKNMVEEILLKYYKNENEKIAVR